jgi:hypothetical protein
MKKMTKTIVYILCTAHSLSPAMEDREPLFPLAMQPSIVDSAPTRNVHTLQDLRDLNMKKYQSLFDDQKSFFSCIPHDIHSLIAQQIVYAQHGNEYADFKRRYQSKPHEGFLAALQHKNPLVTDDAHIISMITDDFDLTARDEYTMDPLAWALIFNMPREN